MALALLDEVARCACFVLLQAGRADLVASKPIAVIMRALVGHKGDRVCT